MNSNLRTFEIKELNNFKGAAVMKLQNYLVNNFMRNFN